MENTTASELMSMMPQTSIHPLLLSPVTSKVMEYLNVRDLVNCRLVCQQWNRSACLSLRLQKRKTIKFRMKLEHLEQYTNTMAKSQDKPFCFYELEFFDMSHSIVQYFLETCGKTMNSLQLNMCRCTTLKIAEILQKQAPQLKTFSMNMDPIEDVGSILTLSKTSNGKKLSLPHLNELSLIGEHSQNPRLISDLIEAACNLEKIDFRCYDLDCETSSFEIMCFDVLTTVNNNNNNNSTQVSSSDPSNERENNNNNNNHNNDKLINSARYIVEQEERRQQSQTLKKLKKFSMHYRLDNDEQLIRLSQKNLRLTHLNMNVNCTAISSKILFNLLEGLSYTLENLELDFGPGSGSQEKLYKFPLLRKLSRLVLTQFKGSSLSYLLNNNYTLNSLKYLSLINCGPLQATFFDLDQIYSNITTTTTQDASTMANTRSISLSKEMSPCKLESLVITNLIEDPLVIIQISTVFPNLVCLDAQLTNSTLRTVFERIPKLEELILFCGDKINDEGITGISEEDLIWLALEDDDENMLMDYENNLCKVYRDQEDMNCDEEQSQQENEQYINHNNNHTKNDIEEEGEYYGPKKSKRRQYRQFPYIGDLERLRVLKLDECTSVSDASVIHGIAHNTHLTSISLTNSQITDISLRCIGEKLTRLRKFETLSPNSIFTHQEKLCLRKKLYMCDFILNYQDLKNIYCPKFKFNTQMEMLLDFFSN